MLVTPDQAFPAYPTWLEDAVFYEIYRQSFNDSDGDGIGDIPGIIARLDYLASLGVNAVWLNPCFVSPFQDAGYDISDFYQVAPRYGTNADLENLFTEARRRGIRIFLDLAPGHTSWDHPWFKESARHARNAYSDWFIWTNSVWAPTEGFKGVSGLYERNGSYISNFFVFQPALNFGFASPDTGHPWQQPVDAPGPQAVRQEIKNIMRFWLERGAAGFRVDMAFSLVKNDGGRRETKRFWQEIRAWLDSDYPEAALVSEWGRPAEALQGRRLRAQRGAHPMQWDAEGPNAGFSSAPPEALYLPLDPRPDRPSVAGQADDPGSLLNQVRALIALSKQHPALCAGAEFSVLYAEAGQYPLVYERRAPRTATPGAGRAGADRLVVAINPSGRPVQVELPDGLSQVAPVTLYGADGVFSAATTGWSLSMPAVSAGVYRVP